MLSKVLVDTIYCSVLHEGKMAACASAAIEQGYALIQNVIVNEKFRGLGLGEKLCRALIAKAKEHGAEHAYLQVVQTNEIAARLYEKLGFDVCPNATEERHDIIQAVTFGKPEGVIAFCEGVQAAAPVDSFVSPEPWDMPGYDAQVIMAAGAFVSGSSIELSADGPIKEPYSVFFQGGLTWPHAKLGILKTLQKLVDAGLVSL